MKHGYMPVHLIPFGKLLLAKLALVHKGVGEVHDLDVPEQVVLLLALLVADGALVQVGLLDVLGVLLAKFVGVRHG